MTGGTEERAAYLAVLPPIVTPLVAGAISGLIFSSSQSCTLGPEPWSLGIIAGDCSPVPVCLAMASSESTLLLARKVRN